MRTKLIRLSKVFLSQTNKETYGEQSNKMHSINAKYQYFLK